MSLRPVYWKFDHLINPPLVVRPLSHWWSLWMKGWGKLDMYIMKSRTHWWMNRVLKIIPPLRIDEISRSRKPSEGSGHDESDVRHWKGKSESSLIWELMRYYLESFPDSHETFGRKADDWMMDGWSMERLIHEWSELCLVFSMISTLRIQWAPITLPLFASSRKEVEIQKFSRSPQVQLIEFLQVVDLSSIKEYS